MPPVDLRLSPWPDSHLGQLLSEGEPWALHGPSLGVLCTPGIPPPGSFLVDTGQGELAVFNLKSLRFLFSIL